MSFDLTLFTRKSIELTEDQMDQFSLKKIGDNLIHEAEEWQLTFTSFNSCDSSLLPKQLKRLKRGIKFSCTIIIEPLNYPESAQEYILAILEFLTNEFDGILEDHQGKNYYNFDSVFEEIVEENDYLKTVCLAWYFNDLAKLQGKNFSRLLDILEEYLPEALPKRYSDYSFEYQYYQKLGRQKFEDFVKENIAARENITIHWIPKNPVFHIDLPDKPDASKHFWSWTLKINIPYSVFHRDDFNRKALKCWKAIIELFDPYYSEVRRIEELKYCEGRAARMIGTTPIPKPNPIFKGYWTGIPKELGTAISLNQQLVNYWPSAKHVISQLNNNQFILHADTLVSDETLNKVLGKVPRKLRERRRAKKPRILPE